MWFLKKLTCIKFHVYNLVWSTKINTRKGHIFIGTRARYFTSINGQKAIFHKITKEQSEYRRISLQTNIRILEATVMTVVKYGSEAWALRKADENLLDVFQRNCLQIVLGTRLTGRISNSRLYEKCGSIPLSRAIMKERLRRLGHVLRWRMTDNRTLSFLANRLGLHGKQVVLVWVGRMS